MACKPVRYIKVDGQVKQSKHWDYLYRKYLALNKDSKQAEVLADNDYKKSLTWFATLEELKRIPKGKQFVNNDNVVYKGGQTIRGLGKSAKEKAPYIFTYDEAKQILEQLSNIYDHVYIRESGYGNYYVIATAPSKYTFQDAFDNQFSEDLSNNDINVNLLDQYKEGNYVDDKTIPNQLTLFAPSAAINYTLKSINVLNSKEADMVFRKGDKNNWSIEKILTELQIPSAQKELILSFNTRNREQILTNLLANYSYTIEINTAKEKSSMTKEIKSANGFSINGDIYDRTTDEDIFGIGDKEIFTKNNKEISEQEYRNALFEYNNRIETPTQHYSNLTVPGGTNYTENEIAIPGVEMEEKPQGVSVKEGVNSVFESNPELANAVYEALEFRRTVVTDIATAFREPSKFTEEDFEELKRMGYTEDEILDKLSAKEVKTALAKTVVSPEQKQQAQQLYSQYLDTIFPDSKVKDIVYHGGYIDKNSIFKLGGDSREFGRGIYFTPSKQSAQEYMSIMGDAPNLIEAIVNLTNPVLFGDEKPKKGKSKEYIESKISKNPNNDGTIYTDTKLIGNDMGVDEKFNHEVKVNSPEQIHILGSKQDIEGFKKWIKDNTKTVRKGAITPSIKGHAQFATDNGIGWFRSDDKHPFTGFLEDLLASGTIKKVPCE